MRNHTTPLKGGGGGEAKFVEKKGGGLMGVAIDKDKGSRQALKWATENLLGKGQTALLIHVKLIPPPHVSSTPLSCSLSTPWTRPTSNFIAYDSDTDPQLKELILPFRCFCTRKNVEFKVVILEGTDVAKAILDYIDQVNVETLVVGSPSKSGFLRRFKASDIPGSLAKGAPEFCNVYVVSKGKGSILHAASRPAPLPSHDQQSPNSPANPDPLHNNVPRGPSTAATLHHVDTDTIKSPLTRRDMNAKPYSETPQANISFVSCCGRTGENRMFPSFYSTDPSDVMARTPQRLSNSSDIDNRNFDLFCRKSLDCNSPHEFLPAVSSEESHQLSWSQQQPYGDVEAEMHRLKLELKQTMDMYSTACKEALTAKQKAMELQQWKMEEQQRLEEARVAEGAAVAIAEREKAKSRAAMEQAEVANKMAEMEAQRRMKAEMLMAKEGKESTMSRVRYRRYAIEEIEEATEMFAESRKVGEGGYGPVYKCNLDHTPVAVKVLRPDAAAQGGRSQFNQEVEVLSCTRHPNMVLLLGACPEYGCLVYEYMANGSLEDCLFPIRKSHNAPPLPWQLRFRIAAEIGTGLLFLHQTKPEPLVHRDLKPGNILLDRNFVSKISDVGLSRLVPPSVANKVTEYRITSTAGTFCYIDPEYQQTGMLGIKSDVYSLGIMLLQILTAKPPMGLTHHVERAIESGTFANVLDPSVPDWPVAEALRFANVALQCAELRRRDRPDLAEVVLPELNLLRAFAEDNMHQPLFYNTNMARSHAHDYETRQKNVQH